MAKKNTEKQGKPKEILELEKVYNLQFEEFYDDELFDDIYRFMRVGFSRNDNNQIIALSIDDCGLENVEPLIKFKNLAYLSLSNNNFQSISEIFPQPELRYLFLGGNKISDINFLSSSKLLEELAIWGNDIVDYSVLKEMSSLRTLSCQNLKITNIDFINYMPDLQVLYAQKNNIRDIKILGNCMSLKTVHLMDNDIRNISKKIAEKFDWLEDVFFHENYGDYGEQPNIDIKNNPLEFPPISVIALGPETTKNYYETSEQFGHAPLSEGRIIFIGDGSSGKSSIIEKVLHGTFEKGRTQTNGIKIEHFQLPHPEGGRNLNFHIWDFGGQEIQHAVHKFFFTEGCLYVLVLDNRKEEEPEYWLQQIESLGGKAQVIVVFNKQDENAAETVDRKYLREKYPNIVGFYKTSCSTGFGIDEFKKEMNAQVVKLRTVNEQFPNNWLKIKKAIEEHTSGSQHYLTYETFRELCKQNETDSEATQKLLLKYFNTIGAVTWFGDDVNLNLFHVLNPKWITQGVYKIITAKKTAHLFGQIQINDFKELLQPVDKEDYTYDEAHYAYILGMMKKFDLCETIDKNALLIPSAFGKEPKVEYSEFKGETVRTYILQFKSYMPLALIHRYTTKNIKNALDNNYWYTGIVIKDSKSNSVAMIHADKEAKRMYVRIKGETQLGLWEHIRREFEGITSSYAKIPYDELVAVDGNEENHVNYDDLVSHLQAQKKYYFHSKLKKDFKVGYLMGYFQAPEETIEKMKKGEITLGEFEGGRSKEIPPIYINIVNDISPNINTQVNTQFNIDIDIVNNIGNDLRGEAVYWLGKIGESNEEIKAALQDLVVFSDDVIAAKTKGEIKGKGWGRKLKDVIQTLGNYGEQFKNIKDGKEALANMLKGVQDLAQQFNLHDIVEVIKNIPTQ